MLTRFVRNQLIIFTIASIVGVTVMLFAYMQLPTLLNVGRLTRFRRLDNRLLDIIHRARTWS